MIELKNICKIYKSKSKVSVEALKDVTFSLPNQGLIFIVGTSGSGKTTLLNMLGGLDKYSSGELIIDGKSMNKFHKKDFNSYRNTYVGFVFQDFNLLEEYNVYENIELAKNLQKQKLTKGQIEDLLKSVGLEQLSKRKINELSGGQKQRVAIARALIKEPNLILADEPTGSLDSSNSRQIIELLKEISKNKLVVVVSHDIDLAKEYADRIIRIEDGKVVSDDIITMEEVNAENKFTLKKASLPFLPSLKFAFKTLKQRKIRLFFTLLLITLSLTFLGMSQILTNFDIVKSYADSLIKENETKIELNKNLAYNKDTKEYYDSGNVYFFEPEEVNEIKEKTKTEVYEAKVAYENNQNVVLEFDMSKVRENVRNAYYANTYLKNKIIEIDKNNNLIKQKVIGRYPENSDEILIHKYLADYIIKNSVVTYETDGQGKRKETFFSPTSYEEILSSNKKLKFGNTSLRIVGIIDDDLSSYSYLNGKTTQEIMGTASSYLLTKEQYKYMEFVKKIMEYSDELYVNHGFFDYINATLIDNSIIDEDLYGIKANMDNKDYDYSGGMKYYPNGKEKTKIYDGNKIITITSLKDNEIIINSGFLDMISQTENKNFSKQWTDYQTNYQNEMTAYEKMIDSGNVPNYEFKYLDDTELYIQFLKEFLKTHPVLNKVVNFSINPYDEFLQSGSVKFSGKIIGIQLDGENVYCSQNNISPVLKKKIQTENIIFKEQDREKLTNDLTEFPIKNSKYTSKTIFSDIINSITDALVMISNVGFYASIVFGVFALLLIINYIGSSIADNKKQIGILRALGARTVDVFKIFLYESSIICFISVLCTYIFCEVICKLANSYISSKLFFDINIIMFNPKIFIVLLGEILIVIFIIALVTVNKISKMKPVDIINNK